MCGFSVNTSEQFTVWFPCYEGVEEGDLVVILSFYGEADGRVFEANSSIEYFNDNDETVLQGETQYKHAE